MTFCQAFFLVAVSSFAAGCGGGGDGSHGGSGVVQVHDCSGDGCPVADPCAGDVCCGDPCCGDSCCGDPYCGEPVPDDPPPPIDSDPCNGDPCCGQDCQDYSLHKTLAKQNQAWKKAFAQQP